jgi:acyl-CoA reductase-like NAD-dependent aldehyde dehydrogenase
MPTPEHFNWIAGKWIRARSELTFESRAAAGRWPRSAAADLAQAVEALAREDSPWARVPRRERFEILWRAASALSQDVSVAPALAAASGLDVDEARAALDADGYQLFEALEFWRDGTPTSRAATPGLFAAHWSDLAGRLGARLARRMLDGDPVVLLGDARMPAIQEAWVRALEAAQLPEGALSLLWDDRSSVLAAALDHPAIGWIRAAGTHEALVELARRDRRGVIERTSLWPVRNKSLALEESRGTQELASCALDRALGRVSTFSGQLPGQVARLVCPERSFSAFTQAFLAALAEHPAAVRPLAPIDADTGEFLAAAWSLGLDEGATAIFGSEPQRNGPLTPIVFTNVDPSLELAHLARPAPLIGLVRARDGAHAQALVRELDRPVPIRTLETRLPEPMP